jgi:hypothetical protein
MSLSLKQSKLFSGLLLLLVGMPAFAHEIEMAGDVAATFHIEPNHQPRAGKPARAWFALTRRGGTPISLAQCKCQLAIYKLPRGKNTATPLMKPALSSLNVEQYKGVPQATITFPKPGLYELVLTGTSQAGATFKSFTLDYQVTVLP